MKGNNLKDLNCEINEILDVSYNQVDVKFVALLKGFKYVFMVRVEEEETNKVVKNVYQSI